MNAIPEIGDTVAVAGRDGEWRLEYFIRGIDSGPNARPGRASVCRYWWPVGGSFRATDIKVLPAELALIRRGYEYPVQPDPYA